VTREKPNPSTTPGDRRGAQRVEVSWSVDCETADTFLYAWIQDISELGIFVRTARPYEVGTILSLRFSPSGQPEFVLRGMVQWINPVRTCSSNPNPGMGVRFLDLAPGERERLVEEIKTIAYLRGRSTELQ